MSQPMQSVLAIVITLSISGCSWIITRPVADADRDSTGNFDGRWMLQLQPNKGRQQVGNAYFICDFKARAVHFSVKNGVASMYYGNKKVDTNVSMDGRFRFEIETDRHYSSTRTGEKSIGSSITDIYQGNLSDSSLKGQFIIGKRSENNHGCATKIKIKKN